MLDDDFVDVESGSSGSQERGAEGGQLHRQISPRPASLHDSRLVACAVPSPACGDAPEAPKLEFAEFRRHACQLAEEYFLARDCRDMVASISLLGCPTFHDELASLLLRASMDRGDDTREAVVLLLNALVTDGLLTDPQMARGFEKLVLGWEDLQLDVPDAPGQLAALLSARVGLLDRGLFARLPEGLVQKLVVGLEPGPPREALEKHLAALREFKAGMDERLAEVLAGGAAEDVVEWLSRADKASFHHEVVLGACLVSLDDEDAQFQERRRVVLCLLAHLSSNYSLTDVDIQMGFSRLLGSLQHSGGALTSELQKNNRDQVTSLFRGAVEHELLPAEFLKSVRRMRFGGSEGVEVIRNVERQTPMHSRRVWGSGDARHFRQEVRESIVEYFDAHNSQELGRIVEELHLSDQEQTMFIRKLLVTGMERGEAEAALDAAEALLGRCWTLSEVRGAFVELRDVQEDLVLDFPRCRECATELVFAAVGRGLLEQQDLICDGANIV